MDIQHSLSVCLSLGKYYFLYHQFIHILNCLGKSGHFIPWLFTIYPQFYSIGFGSSGHHKE